MEKCVIDFEYSSDWEYATKKAQSMGIKPWDIIAKRRVDAYRLIVYFQNKEQVQEFLEFLASERSKVKLNDIKIHQRKKWKEKGK